VTSLRRGAGALFAIVLAGVLWVPNVHRLYARDASAYRARAPDEIAPNARALAEDQIALWRSPELRASRFAPMRAANPEWDLMARAFLVLALGDMALRSPIEAGRFLDVIDTVLHDTIDLERTEGQSELLLPYASAHPFVAEGGRSLFVDGEIALMLGVRQVVRVRAEYAPLLRERARLIERALAASPSASGESYPDECWTFCNTSALAALRMVDLLEGTRHEPYFSRWIGFAKRHLIDPETGLLASSYTYRGVVKDGPEGSTLWMSAHNLLLIDEAFARDQYARARRELGAEVFGFAYAREWPRLRRGPADIDSGPIVPLLDVSPGSSGLALLGASAFDDRPFLEGLFTTLGFAAFPEERDGALRFRASNALGDAVMLEAAVFGPVWDRVRASRAAEASR
jgi:hypothetical protein